MNDTDTIQDNPARVVARELDCFLEDEVRDLLNVVPATLRNWRARRQGPEFITVGNRTLYPKQPFARWLSSRTKQTSP